MSYIGDFRLGDTFDTKFTTRQISGAPSTLSSSPVISAYVGNSTTEITAGITLSVDFDSRTGLNNVRVVATSGNGYATASNYQLVITTGTVNSVSVVGEVIAEFSIENRSALMPTTGGRTLVVDAAGLADANMVKMGPTGSGTAQTARDIGTSVLLSSGTGTGQLKLASGYVAMTWADIAAPTTTVNLSGTTIAAVTGAVGSVTGAVGSVTGLTASDVGAIKTQTDKFVFTVANQVDSNVITKTGFTLSASGSAALTEGYRANGATGTIAQLLYEILAHVSESAIVTTVKTINKLDHVTPVATFTLDSATAPTSITRAT